ncbi:Cytochrome P [Trema orientale]|uniref:Cytochrome P n=1 Tax=Trema orientale TaxID=63057 RepID=A0A2P5BCD4_TREOI|nr:Cytochrome P [Trema orientale]
MGMWSNLCIYSKALQDVKFKGLLIPTQNGRFFQSLQQRILIDPCLHEKSRELTFDMGSLDKVIRKKVTPFGGGLRLCQGAELAKVVITYLFFLHHLVLN